MPIDIGELVIPLEAAINPPGAVLVDGTPAEYASALRGGFWNAKLDGFFAEYRIDPLTDAITPVPPYDVDLPGELQQLVVNWAAMSILELAMATLDTKFRAKSGEDEFETGKTASLLIQVLAGRRADMDRLRLRLVERPALATYVGFYDLVSIRLGHAQDRSGAWVSG